MTWSLAEHARQVVEGSPIADPHLLARKVALTIPDDRLRDAVDEMIGGYVVSLVTRSRWSLPTGQRSVDTQLPNAGGDLSAADGQNAYATQDLPAVGSDSPDPGQPLCDTQERSAGVRKPSMAAYAAVYKLLLDERLPGVDNEWKFLRDFDRDDCTWAASERRRKAEPLLRNAAKFEACAAALIEYDRPTVGDLPDDVLQEVLG